MIGEVRTWPTDATLDFVEDKQGVVLGCELMRTPRERFGDGVNATFSLNKFEYDSGGVGGEGRFESRNVITLYKTRAREERFEILAILRLTVIERAPKVRP